MGYILQLSSTPTHGFCFTLLDVSCLYFSHEVTVLDTGATHDSTVLNESDFYANPDRFFQDNVGYIMGDSAYRLSNRVIKPFIKSDFDYADGPEGVRDMEAFNRRLSEARVKVEHTYGLLKSRFQMLDNLGVLISDLQGNKRVLLSMFLLSFTCRLRISSLRH